MQEVPGGFRSYRPSDPMSNAKRTTTMTTRSVSSKKTGIKQEKNDTIGYSPVLPWAIVAIPVAGCRKTVVQHTLVGETPISASSMLHLSISP